MTTTRSLPFSTLLLAAAALGGCHHGGGGSAAAAPTIVSAAFSGATTTPAAGDTLLLFFSADVTLVTGKLLTNSDVSLTTGASLGTVTAAPTLVNSRSVQITLGSGVSFVPGTTAIALAAGNDVVVSTTGMLGTGGTAVVITKGDGTAPLLSNLTLNGINSELNGTGPAGGTLQVPANGFTIDLAYSDNSSVDTSRTQIVSSLAVGTAAGTQPPGTNLVPFLTATSLTAAASRFTVPAAVSLAPGITTLTAYVVDITGLPSAAHTFVCTVKPITDALRPFETAVNSSQVWFLDLSRDVESYSVNLGNVNTPVVVTAGASGTADLDELLLVLGQMSATPIANVQGSENSNDVLLDRFKTTLLANLAALYSGANITFTFTRPAGSFGTNSSVAYNALGYSQICVAGSADASGTSGILGIAIFDPNNATQNDDTLLDFNGQGRLGIFLHTVINAGFLQSSSSDFRQTFDAFTPARSGTPIGNDASDGQRLLGTLTDARASAIDAAIAGIGRFTAVVLAHECGHSMGLVQDGAMPVGLYGGDAVNFPGSTSGHIRNASLFPPGSINVMSPSLSYSVAINAATAFNTLNIAYLREQVLYGN